MLFNYLQLYGVVVAVSVGTIGALWKIKNWYKNRGEDLKTHLSNVVGKAVDDVKRDNKLVEERLTNKIEIQHGCVLNIEKKIDIIKDNFDGRLLDLKDYVKANGTEIKEMQGEFSEHLRFSERKMAEINALKQSMPKKKRSIKKSRKR